ncbi:hypothetical protein FJZ17_00765 [Candidatus Pacearchaeota archaeon]|nr:hypothetical protein [Candidatus Pacearchaeota archaeon]
MIKNYLTRLISSLALTCSILQAQEPAPEQPSDLEILTNQVNFSSADVDLNNRINWQEYYGYFDRQYTNGIPPLVLNSLRKDFDRYDANRDRAVTDAEYANGNLPEDPKDIEDIKQPPKPKRDRSIKQLYSWGKGINSRINKIKVAYQKALKKIEEEKKKEEEKAKKTSKK